MMCTARQHLLSSFRCTLDAGHGGDVHVAEGRINHRTGRAPVLATWPVETAANAESDGEAPPRQVTWKRIAAGRHRGSVAREPRYQLRLVGSRWIVSTISGQIIGTAPTIETGKDIAEGDLRDREGSRGGLTEASECSPASP